MLATSALFSSTRVNLRALKDTYFQALLVQAFGNGLIAGMILLSAGVTWAVVRVDAMIRKK